MTLTDCDSYIKVSDFGGINLPVTLTCGQAFRWLSLPDGSFSGIADGHFTRVIQENDSLLFYSSTLSEVRDFWVSYFALDMDYPSFLSHISLDPCVHEMINSYGVIRILRQQPWETLCTFIMSSCNNIPRITKIIAILCSEFGNSLNGGNAFPTAERILEAGEEALAVLHAGYRTPFLLDAASKVCSGEIDLESLREQSEEKARESLMKIKGVGRKVADCTLLFSLGFDDVFPVDRHIARAVAQMYPDGLPECFCGCKGLSQQYIFHYQRTYNV